LASLALGAAFVVACSGVTSGTDAAPASGVEIAPPFVDFVAENGGEAIFGEPFTAPFVDPAVGRTVQYFERMRLEEDPTMPEGSEVRIAAIGEWAVDGLPFAFDATEYPIEGAFLGFYDRYRGERIFGRAITPLFEEGELLVQYFENGRLEWHPEAPLSDRVQVGYLARSHFADSGMALIYQDVVNAGPVEAAAVTGARVFAAIREPILYRGDEQVLYVEVQAPDGHAVQGMPVSYTLTYDDDSLTMELGTTDSQGKVQGVIPLLEAAPGQRARVDVHVPGSGGRELARTSLTFKLWW
jgi:hypothetical protein